MSTIPTTSADRMDEVEDLRRELQRLKKYVREDDPELYQAITEWCTEAIHGPVRGVRVLVRRRLSELARDNRMRDHRGVEDPSEAFPDACEGCPHYKVACPMLKNHLVKVELDRILEEFDDDVAARERIYELATRQNCHVLQDELEEFEDEHAGFIARGYRLRNRVVATVTDALDPDDLPTPDAIEGGVGEATGKAGTDRHEPPPQVAERVDQVIAAVDEEVAADGGGS